MSAPLWSHVLVRENSFEGSDQPYHRCLAYFVCRSGLHQIRIVRDPYQTGSPKVIETYPHSYCISFYWIHHSVKPKSHSCHKKPATTPLFPIEPITTHLIPSSPSLSSLLNPQPNPSNPSQAWNRSASTLRSDLKRKYHHYDSVGVKPNRAQQFWFKRTIYPIFSPQEPFLKLFLSLYGFKSLKKHYTSRYTSSNFVITLKIHTNTMLRIACYIAFFSTSWYTRHNCYFDPRSQDHPNQIPLTSKTFR